MSTNNALNNMTIADFSTVRSDPGNLVLHSILNSSVANIASSVGISLNTVVGGDAIISWGKSATTAWNMGYVNTTEHLEIRYGFPFSSATTLFSMDPVTLSLANAIVTQTSSLVGLNLAFGTVNTDNTNAGSSAAVAAGVGGSSAGDPYFQLGIIGTTFNKFGLDNSASDVFTYNVGCTPGASGIDGTPIMQMTQAGEVTKPLQPAFNYYNSATRTDVTGDNTTYTLIFDSANWTQQGSGFDGTSTFTAPLTGVYDFNLMVRSTGWILQTSAYLSITCSSGVVYFGPALNPANQLVAGFTNGFSMGMNALIKMTAGQTVTCQINGAGSTKTIDIDGTQSDTYFSGILLA